MNKFILVKLCLKHRCYAETDYLLSKIDCWLYSLKCIICILLNEEATEGYFEHINVATISVHTWNSYHEGLSGAIEYLAVGSDSWHYAFIQDGWP